MRSSGLVERRSSPRRRAGECGWLQSARVRPGRDVIVLDLSTGGALVEAAVRMMPGASIVLHLIGVGCHHTVRGTVLRCYVAAIDRATGVRYRAALGFEEVFQVADAAHTPHGNAPAPSEARAAVDG